MLQLFVVFVGAQLEDVVAGVVVIGQSDEQGRTSLLAMVVQLNCDPVPVRHHVGAHRQKGWRTIWADFLPHDDIIVCKQNNSIFKKSDGNTYIRDDLHIRLHAARAHRATFVVAEFGRNSGAARNSL